MKVAILLCTFNGESFIKDQLESIKNQTFKNFDIYLSDDGSEDNTLAIVSDFMDSNQNIRMKVLHSNSNNFVKNYFSLISVVESDYDFYAFSDQDDIWDKDKLRYSINELKSLNKDKEPSLYCSRTILINDKAKIVGKSIFFRKKPSFENALTQSLAGANTMVFNKIFFNLLKKVPTENKEILTSHDWIAYLIISGVNGNIIYNERSHTFYRQHKNNLIGSNNSLLSKIYRLLRLLRGDYREWNDKNILMLDEVEFLLPKHKAILEKYKEFRNYNNSLFERLSILRKLGIYRQTAIGNLMLIIGNILRKI